MFEETVPKYLDQAASLGFDLQEMAARGILEIVYVRPLDLSVDETLYAIQTAVEKIKARRVVLDSISGLEAALAPAYKEDFLESLYRLLGALTGVGITVLLTVEVTDAYNQMRFTPHAISFLTHDIVLHALLRGGWPAAHLHGRGEDARAPAQPGPSLRTRSDGAGLSWASRFGTCTA